MTGLRIWWARVRDALRARRVHRDLRVEISAHLAEATEEFINRGQSPEEARFAALRSFGGVSQAEEASREARSFQRLDYLCREARRAVSALVRTPIFTTIAVLTLALGIGAVTALFNVVDGVVLKPLNYPDSGRIVRVMNNYTDRQVPLLTGGDWIDVAAERGVFDAISYYQGGEMGVQLGDRAEFVGAALVHPDFFRVFGLAPVAGRSFTTEDAEQSAMVSAGFALRNYGSAAAALDRSVFIDSRSYRIVGVMPASMQFPERIEVWAASSREPSNRNRSGHNYRTVAKLAPGVSVHLANARLAQVAARLAAAFPVSNHDKTFTVIPLRESLAGQVRPMLFALMAAVVVLLLIACANVANLMLARGEARVREVAVRAALGASRAQIAGQLLAESLVLATTACAFGLLFAYLGTRALLTFGTSYVPLPRLNDVHIDWRVLCFAISVSMAITIACGLLPAMRAARISVADALNHGSTRSAIGGRSKMRNALVVTQIALSCVLAVNAGLLLRSFVRLTEVPLGFERDGVLVMYAHAPASGSISDGSGLDNYLRAGRFFDDLLGRIRTRPEVVAAGAAMGLPTGQYDSDGAYAVEGRHSFGGDFRLLPSAGFRLASPAYFRTLGIPLLRGREFDDGDVYERPAVAIISESLARQTFGAENPLGHRIMCGLDRVDVWMTIVGVVGDVRQDSPASPPAPELYMPLRQHPYAANELQVVVRTRIPPESFIPTLHELVRTTNRDVAMKFTTLADSVNGSIAGQRFRTSLVSAFAGLAVALALTGIYAVMSYTIAQRTPEFGLRVAIGARSIDVVRLVLADAGRLSLAGVICGLLLAGATTRFLAASLFGVTPADAVTYGLVMLLGLPLVGLAAAVPALRAARVDPLIALRS